jgi:aminopeptidase N
MLSARRGGGFNINDLVAAFEEQVHQNVAEFVRHWMKRPGVPEDFRARYESASAASAGNSVFAITTKKKESRP